MSPKKALHYEIMQRVDKRSSSTWIATCFGVGFLYPASGTWGTAIGLFIAAILYIFMGKAGILGALLAICIFAIPAIRDFTKQADTDDAGAIVIDEVAGIFITLLFTMPNFENWILAFLLFRFFDILKPFPICWLDENIKGPWGVMVDDMVAGLLAGIVLLGVNYAFFI